ncbi:NifB/NifX family molybdenum-iron cluster-binding protein [Candidatus Chlorohelix sp.]|uniref:NifB/NifX family molybdenum-iron cluster-binding protein n=1 Tax=Candidatus Chlorohelix sp. TaxID=3139201 RepID=UPI00307313F1
MKIAVATNDGKTISVHFGKSQYFMVVTVDEGKEVARELRDRSVPSAAAALGFAEDEANTPKHNTDHLADCKVVISRGMGGGMLWFLQQAKYRVILTEVANIDRAINEFIEGRLLNHPEFVQ